MNSGYKILKIKELLTKNVADLKYVKREVFFPSNSKY